MADSSVGRISPSKTVCRYFLTNSCMRGDNCQYLHKLISPSRQDRVSTETNRNLEQEQDGIVDFNHIKAGEEDVGGGQVEAQGQSSVRSSDENRRNRESATAGVGRGCASRSAASTASSENAAWSRESDTSGRGSASELASFQLKPEDWVMAAEFVPGQRWQSIVVSSDSEGLLAQASEAGDLSSVGGDVFGEIPKADDPDLSLTSVFASPDVVPELASPVSNEELCELCQSVFLTTMTEEERRKHVTECIENHEKEMERSFAIQRSQEKMCGICMDVVWEKAIVSEQRFGILSNCNHVFCLSCIRKWRSAKQFENKIVRACPECRVKSDFVTPSRYWVEDKEDKKKLIEEYKLALSKKPCKYFDKGRGECPFNEKCFYLHALPDGRVASPKPVYRRRRPPTTSTSQTDSSSISHMVLYEFLDTWQLDHWEDIIFRLNFFEFSLPSSSDEDDDDADDDFDDSDLSGVL